MTKYLLSGKLEGRRALALEHTVHKHAILAVADHVKVRRFEVYFNVTTGNKTVVAHVDVHVALAGVAADHHPTLTHHVFEFLAFEPGDGSALPVGGPGGDAVRGGRRRLLKG